MPFKRILVPVLLIIMIGIPSSVSAKRYHVTNGGFILGMDYFTSLEESHHDDFFYWHIGALHEREKYYIDVNISFLPLLIDFIAGVFRAIKTGELGFPIWEGLNDDTPDPGRLRLLDTVGRYSLYTHRGHKLDVGLGYDAWSMGARFYPVLSPGEIAELPGYYGDDIDEVVFSSTYHNVSFSAGYGFRSDYFSTNISFDLGNGFNSRTTAWNPYFGAEALSRVKFFDYMGLYVRVLFRLQRFDYSGYEPSSSGHDKIFNFNQVEWEPMLTIDVGFIFTALESKRW